MHIVYVFPSPVHQVYMHISVRTVNEKEIAYKASNWFQLILYFVYCQRKQPHQHFTAGHNVLFL